MRPPRKPDQGRSRDPGTQHAAMRRNNENTILARLRRQPGLSGSAVAKSTGLAPQTVSVLLRSLESEGLIARGSVLRGKRGQPAVPFSLRGEAAYAIGVEIGWQHADFVLLDLAGNITPGKRISYPYPNPDTLLAELVAGVDELRATFRQRKPPLLGIGISLPSALGERAWVLGASPQECQRLAAIDLVAELAAATGLPVTPNNDGAVALWAETAFGRVPQDRDCSYAFLSTFIGGALYVDGRVLKGKSDHAGRIGAAMTSQPDGTVNMLHFSASLWALAGLLKKRGIAVTAHDYLSWDWAAIEPVFAEWLERASRDFALAFANIAAVVGVSCVVMDGILPRPLLARIVNAIQTRINAMPIELFEPPMVLLGQRGASAPAIGAAYELFHARYFDA